MAELATIRVGRIPLDASAGPATSTARTFTAPAGPPRVPREIDPPEPSMAQPLSDHPAAGPGRFGRVYLAWDDELDGPVAVNAQREAVAGPQDVERYLAEARMVAKLDHPQIVPVYDVGRTDDGLCYVQGVSRGRVDLGGRPPRPPTDPDVRVKRIWLFIS